MPASHEIALSHQFAMVPRIPTLFGLSLGEGYLGGGSYSAVLTSTELTLRVS